MSFFFSSSSSSATTSSSSLACAAANAAHQEQLLSAQKGLDLLLNDDIAGAKAHFTSAQHKDSAYTLAGLGICEFLTAVVGQEEDRLTGSMETLHQAERAAKKGKGNAEMEKGAWWSTPGLEYEILVADVVAAQALLHVLGDSYMEYMRAVWKLNSAFKHFSTIYKAVFPKDIKSDTSIQSIVADLNDRYQANSLSSTLQSTSLKRGSDNPSKHGSTNTTSHKHTGAIGRLKKAAGGGGGGGGPGPRTTSSASDLPALGKAGGAHLNHHPNHEDSSASLPASTSHSVTATPPNGHLHPANGTTGTAILHHHDTGPNPYGAQWLDSPMISFIVSGGAFGHALFELIFALMPAKGRKMFSWLGYGTGDRKKALKLLELSAMTGSDIHSSFAALTLVSYYCVILLMSGWQSNREELLNSASAVLSRAMGKHESGTLWLLNKAKLARLSGDVDTAVEQLRAAMARRSQFRQAVSSLQFELCWVLLSIGEYDESSTKFAEMVDLNSWSHSTYWALAAGTLQEVQDRTPEQQERMKTYYAKISNSFNGKRFMGQPPSSEVYFEKRFRFYTAKTERWIAAGKLPSATNPTTEWYASVKISLAMELSLYWNQFQTYPRSSLERLIASLTGLLGSSAQDNSEIDTVEERALAETILGVCYTNTQDFAQARKYLERVVSASNTFSEAYTYLGAMACLNLAILECRQAEVLADHESDAKERTFLWRSMLENADSHLDALFSLTGYDMNGRVESRGQMLRVEINEKRIKLGIPTSS